MLVVSAGRLTGQVGGPVYRYLREIALFWQCYLVKVSHPDGSYVYNDLFDCCYEICRPWRVPTLASLNPTEALSTFCSQRQQLQSR